MLGAEIIDAIAKIWWITISRTFAAFCVTKFNINTVAFAVAFILSIANISSRMTAAGSRRLIKGEATLGTITNRTGASHWMIGSFAPAYHSVDLSKGKLGGGQKVVRNVRGQFAFGNRLIDACIIIYVINGFPLTSRKGKQNKENNNAV